jgi:hypothetical protein
MRCHIHGGQEAPKNAFVPHHVCPTSYGGSNTPDNIIYICATCHDILHKAAEALFSGNIGRASELVGGLYPNEPRIRKELLHYANRTAKAKLAWKERNRERGIPDAGEVDADTDTVKVQLDIPRWIHHRLKTMASDHHHPNGRKVGLYAFILKVLEAKVSDKVTSHSAAVGMPAAEDLVEEPDEGMEPPPDSELETWDLY